MNTATGKRSGNISGETQPEFMKSRGSMELDPMFLELGIRVDGKNMEKFFQKVSDFFWGGCRTAEIDGIFRKVRNIALMEWKNRHVFLKLKIENKT